LVDCHLFVFNLALDSILSTNSTPNGQQAFLANWIAIVYA
jgi:hypothetical protein